MSIAVSFCSIHLKLCCLLADWSLNSKEMLTDAITTGRLCAFDWTMLVYLSGKERNESMWHRLIGQVDGLKVKKFWRAPEVKGKGYGEGIVEVVRVA
jgi:hypothetical protein